jgi:hypothetical protein
MRIRHLLACAAGIGCLAVSSGWGMADETPLSVMRAKSKRNCVTIEEKMIGFGEQSSKADAFSKLDSSIAILHVRRPRYATAKEKSRDAQCVVYLKALNEFECTAQATLCR